MHILAYLQLYNIKKKDFAQACDIRPSTLSNYLKGTRKPKLDIARKIEKLTKSKVTIDDMINYWKEKNTHV